MKFLSSWLPAIQGWPVVYIGIFSLSIGAWAHSGVDIGLMTYGISLIIAGLLQYFVSHD